MLMPLIDEANGDAELINLHWKQCKKQARYSCVEEFDIYQKSIVKSSY